jgi:hypothetical protein
MTTVFINGNSRLLIDHANSSYCLQHPKGGGHQNWQESLVADSPEEFLKLYLNKNLNRIQHQPKKMAENVKTVLSALCSA